MPVGLVKSIFRPRKKGQIVFYVLPGVKTVRPAIIVEVIHSESEDLVNLQVFLDGASDKLGINKSILYVENVSFSHHSEENTWHKL